MVILAGGSAVAGKKEKIAILGLEVIGTTSIDSESTRVAQDLTVALRTRPKAGQGPYLWTPGSEKELVDEKIMNNCPNEDKPCMAQIGSNLGADYLVFGKIERKSLGGQAGYQISLKLLKVSNQTMQPGWTEFIPLADSTGTKLQDWARKGYKKLTNDFDGGTLRIKIRNDGFDRGTILIEGEERGNITSASGEVQSLPEGRYKVSILAAGFDRWDSDEKITIRNGETTTEEVTLHKGKVVPGCDPAVSKDCGGTISDDGPKTGLWKALAVVGVVVAGGGTGLLIVSGKRVDEAKIKTNEILNCTTPDGTPITDPPCVKATAGKMDPGFQKFDKQGRDYEKLSYVGVGLIIAGGTLALVGIVKGFVLKGGKEKVSSRAHHRPVTDVVFAPVITPNVAGATLQLSW